MSKQTIILQVSLLYFFISSGYLLAGDRYYERFNTDVWGFQTSDYGPPDPKFGYKPVLVARIQSSLIAHGYKLDDANGLWNKTTQNVLLQFQSEMGLKQTGWIDISTRDNLTGQVKIPFNLVKKVQAELLSNGENPGKIDGYWGPKTESALKRFQKRKALRVTGLLDLATKKELKL